MSNTFFVEYVTRAGKRYVEKVDNVNFQEVHSIVSTVFAGVKDVVTIDLYKDGVALIKESDVEEVFIYTEREYEIHKEEADMMRKIQYAQAMGIPFSHYVDNMKQLQEEKDKTTNEKTEGGYFG